MKEHLESTIFVADGAVCVCYGKVISLMSPDKLKQVDAAEISSH